MYGLLIQSCVDFVKENYGEEMWLRVQAEADIKSAVFNTHTVYSEDLLPKIANALANITGEEQEEIMDAIGVFFVSFVGQYGYDRVLKVLGRNMRDFLNGLDNLHEYLRFSYHQLKPPSFFVEDETKNGLTLTYRSKRKGYVNYVKGQIRQVGKQFYNTEVKIYVVDDTSDEATGMTHVKFRLMFDNKAFKEIQMRIMDNVVENIPLQPELLFELFPFHIVFSRKMEIRSMGQGLRAVMPSAIGNSIVDYFVMNRPLSDFTYHEILKHTNNVFQLATKERVLRVSAMPPSSTQVTANGHTGNKKEKTPEGEKIKQNSKQGDVSTETTVEPLSLSFKGQMLYIHEWDCIIFLGTPIMSSLDDMFRAGLYINDLSMHDSSRDLVLAGTQQSAELKMALDQELEKSRLLEDSMLKLDQEMQRTDALLYQMIPRPVAERLRRGEPSVDTCEVFESVTILFSDVMGFTTICSKITPMQVVSMLNAMYTQFDQLSETHSVYKVETIGDAYMAVSGAPTKTQYHAQHMMEMAMDMRDSMYELSDPSSDDHMKLRIGCHSGTVVAGVVGIKMPRYCLFGDTVNTASRMESGGEAMKIHVSETTKQKLEGFPYAVEERGTIPVKGKGTMKTYWLTGRKEVDTKNAPVCPFFAILEEENQKHRMAPNDGHGSHSASPTHLKRAASPSAYSPVSFRDVNESGHSPVSSRTSSKNNSPHHRDRANTVGCPFATQASSGAAKGNNPQRPPPHTPRKQAVVNSRHNQNIKNVHQSEPIINDSGSCVDRMPNPTMISSNKNNTLSSENNTFKPNTTASSSSQNRSHSNNTRPEPLPVSPSRSRTQVTDGIARVAPMITTPSRMNIEPGNDVKAGIVSPDLISNRASSVTTLKSSSNNRNQNNYTPSSLNNFHELDSSISSHPQRNTTIGNGSVESSSENARSSKLLSKEPTGCPYSDVQDDLDHGHKQTVPVTSGVGCLRRNLGGDEFKSDRKSKTCYIL